MSHLALYRKYRPQTFEEVIGQQAIVKTLQSQIASNNIGHAYLFCGTRGVGKTSIAKIFARSINCLNSKNGSPCLECNNCKENINNFDIIEMDAASNNSVDDIRNLKEKIQYPPVNGKYKVYIIDEVHMLSTGAFNALLKTLEEPPSYAVFILATTESHKIPATILSRCTKFDFRLVSKIELENLLKDIFTKENVKYDMQAISAIASRGEGSVRDTLSIADMCASFSNGEVTYESYLKCMGEIDTDTLFKLIKAVKEIDLENLLLQIKSLYESGKNLTLMIKNLIENLRNILLVKKLKNYKEFLSLPQEVLDKTIALSEIFNEKELLNFIKKLSLADNELRYASNLKLYVETLLLSIALNNSVTTNETSINQTQNQNSNMIYDDKLNEIIEKIVDKKLKNLKEDISKLNVSKTSTNIILPNEEINAKKSIQLDENIENIEKSIEKTTNNDVIKDNSNSNNLNSSIEPIQENTQKNTLSKERFYAEILRNCREKKYISLLTAFNNITKYDVTDKEIIFYTNKSIIKDTINFSKDDLQNIISSINSSMTFKIEEEKNNTQDKIKELSKKFGGNINIKY